MKANELLPELTDRDVELFLEEMAAGDDVRDAEEDGYAFGLSIPQTYVRTAKTDSAAVAACSISKEDAFIAGFVAALQLLCWLRQRDLKRAAQQ